MKQEKKYYLVEDLFKINIRLNKEVLCEGCKRKEIRKLADKCENEEIARFFYQHKPDEGYIRWIPFDEFKNIENLAKGGFGEIQKATWFNDYYDENVVLKRIYNSDDEVTDILKEVKAYY